MNETTWVSVGEASRALGLPVSEVFGLIAAGKLVQRSTAFDALPQTFISLDSVEEYLGRKAVAA
jgi:hypothetical protein